MLEAAQKLRKIATELQDQELLSKITGGYLIAMAGMATKPFRRPAQGEVGQLLELSPWGDSLTANPGRELSGSRDVTGVQGLWTSLPTSGEVQREFGETRDGHSDLSRGVPRGREDTGPAGSPKGAAVVYS